jgi:hypothetical protein
VALLAIEFLFLFFLGTPLFVLAWPRISPIPALWAVTAYCLVTMLRDPNFDRTRLWDTAGLWKPAPEILSLFAVILLLGIVLVLRYAPTTFLSFPRSNPFFWILVMVLYPLLSVIRRGSSFGCFSSNGIAACLAPDGESCWPVRRHSLSRISFCVTLWQSRSRFQPDCFSRCATGKRALSPLRALSTHYTGARSSQSDWVDGFTTAQRPPTALATRPGLPEADNFTLLDNLCHVRNHDVKGPR